MSNLISNISFNNLKALHTAHSLSPTQRQGIACEAIKRDTSVCHIAAKHDVSRKFVYQQKAVAEEALSIAFDSKKVDESKVLFYLPITKRWIHRLVLALLLICHSSFRGVREILSDLFDINLSIGSIHNTVENAVKVAKHENSMERLSLIRVGAHDEIFQGKNPVLVGCDTRSTYCYLLEAVQSRDAQTWGIAMLEASERGLNPDYTIADAGKGLRAGQKLVWPEIPCHGDVFHALQDFGKVSIYLENRAYGILCAKEKAEQKMAKIKKKNKGNKLSRKLGNLRQGCERGIVLADDIALLLSWMQYDILSVFGPDLKAREELFDFVVAELKVRQDQSSYHIGSIRCMLEKQKNDLLKFVRLIDEALAWIADEHGIAEYQVRSVYLLEDPRLTQAQRSKLEDNARASLNYRFYSIQEAVKEAIDKIVRASSVVENLNSRIRNYFFLRKQIGPAYLELLRFFLNHHRFVRSEHSDRVGKSPREIMTGQSHPHWLDLLNPMSCQLAA